MSSSRQESRGCDETLVGRSLSRVTENFTGEEEARRGQESKQFGRLLSMVGEFSP